MFLLITLSFRDLAIQYRHFSTLDPLSETITKYRQFANMDPEWYLNSLALPKYTQTLGIRQWFDFFPQKQIRLSSFRLLQSADQRLK